MVGLLDPIVDTGAYSGRSWCRCGLGLARRVLIVEASLGLRPGPECLPHRRATDSLPFGVQE